MTLYVNLNFDHLPIYVQVGPLVGFYGPFAVLQLDDTYQVPRFLMILGHWIELENFVWDPFYYEQYGGLWLDYEEFVPLEWRESAEASS
jgi:hypothetical protein